MLKDLTQRYPPDVFTDMPEETDVIQLTDNRPIRCKLYALPCAMREELWNEVDSMRVVRPSTLPYASPIIMVKKKNGCNRLLLLSED